MHDMSSRLISLDFDRERCLGDAGHGVNLDVSEDYCSLFDGYGCPKSKNAHVSPYKAARTKIMKIDRIRMTSRQAPEASRLAHHKRSQSLAFSIFSTMHAQRQTRVVWGIAWTRPVCSQYWHSAIDRFHHVWGQPAVSGSLKK